MRLNKFLALYSGLSRRAADQAITAGRVRVNGQLATLGQIVNERDNVTLDNKAASTQTKRLTIMLNKPIGYVCSKDGQGSRTVYDLLPPDLHNLKPIGRLDKDSSGLLLLTNDGQLAHRLTHPSFNKSKVYDVSLSQPLSNNNFQQITGPGVQLDDGLSRLQLEPLNNPKNWRVTMHEGRNRQIRRTFLSVGCKVTKLHRIALAYYRLNGLKTGHYEAISH